MEKSAEAYRSLDLRHSLIGAASAMVLLAAMPGLAYAQDGETGTDEEEVDTFIVTTQHREESVQDVEASVSAVTGDEMADAGDFRIDSFANQFANVNINAGNGSRSTVVTIRGISSNPNNPGIGAAVGVFVDGVYTPRPTTINTNLFDLERVEIVRGPQGVLYGKNTIAGAMNFISPVPSDEYEFGATVSYGNYNATVINGMFNAPLSDRFAIRVSASSQTRDGFMDNTFTGEELNDQNEYGIRASAFWQVTDDVEVVFRGDYSEVDASSGLGEILDNGVLTGSPWEDPNPYDRNVAYDTPSTQTREAGGLSATVNWHLSSGTLTSISAYREFEWFNDTDNDYTTLFYLATGIAEDQSQFSQELRYVSDLGGRFEYIVGGFYMTQDYNTDALGRIGPDYLMMPLVIPFSIAADIDSTSLAAFGQVDYALTDRLVISGGLRYSDEDMDVSHQQFGDGFGGAIVPSYARRNLSRSDSEFTGQASARYEFSDEVTGYVSYSQGFKVGGYNVFSITPTDDNEYEPEYVDSYEIGLRTNLFDRRVRANLTGFYLEYTDLQVNQLELVGNLPQFVTSNAATAEAYGIELEVLAAITDNFQAGLNWGYLHAEFDDYRNATLGGADFTGNDLAQSPEHTVNIFGQLEQPIANGVDLFARAEATYRSSIYFNASNNPILSDGSLTTLNARLGLQADTGMWGVYLWGRNITDEEYPVNMYTGPVIPGQVVQDHAAPATYGVELRVQY